jgi:hypothetical protein
MKKLLDHIIKRTLMLEQDAPAGDAAATPLETDNAPSDAKDSPFTPAEERFLGKFDAYGSKHLGIIYSTSDSGIREFIARSGKELNISPGILRSLFAKKIIKFVPYTGFGRNDDYTIELQLSLDDVKGLGKADQGKAETGSTASGAAPAGGGAPPPPPGPENAGVIRHGHVLVETLNEQKTTAGKLTDVEKTRCDDAIAWWKQIAVSTKSYNWEEESIIDALMSVKSREQALYIDAIGYIFTYDDDSAHPEYFKFIAELGRAALQFNGVPIQLETPAYTIPRLLNSQEFLQSVFYDDLSSDDDYKKIKSVYQSRGIGQLVASKDAAMLSAKGGNVKYFYPAYNTAEVGALVKKLTFRYVDDKDVKKRKQKEKQRYIAKQSEQVKQQIVSNSKLQFKSYNGIYKNQPEWMQYVDKMYAWNKYNLKSFDDIADLMRFQKSSGVFDYGMARVPIKFMTTWKDKSGKLYAAFQSKTSSDAIYRLYADGTITRDVPGAIGKYWTTQNGIYVEWSTDKAIDFSKSSKTPQQIRADKLKGKTPDDFKK